MAALMAVTIIVLLAQDIPLSMYLRQVEHDRIITSLERDAFLLAGRSSSALATPTDTTAVSKLTMLAQQYRTSGGARVVIVGSDGIAIVTSDDDQATVGNSYSSRPEISDALAGGLASGTRYSETLQVELLYVAVPVRNGSDVVGAVRLTFPEPVVSQAVDSQLGALGLVALTTVLLAGLVGFLFSGTVTRRLGQLRSATELLAEGRLSARADPRAGAPEIRSLARSFNAMAARLETLVEQQRHFASDASHQLRTPLTALRLRLERARELLPTDPTAAAQRLAAAESEADRLGSIIEGLLVLSRSEPGLSEPVAIDLAAVLRDRVEHWEPLAAELGVRLELETPPIVTVWAVATAPEQIIDNLVDNALSVSPPASTLELRIVAAAHDSDHVHGHDTGVELHVLDRGPGMSADDRVRAFDRFWRARTGSGGSGLGLAIVAQLASASGATARLDARPGGGLDAVVRFSPSDRRSTSG